jgi:CcmD family protein
MDVAAGFSALLVIILIYVFMMDARGRKLKKELDRLRRMVEDKRG